MQELQSNLLADYLVVVGGKMLLLSGTLSAGTRYNIIRDFESSDDGIGHVPACLLQIEGNGRLWVVVRRALENATQQSGLSF